MSAVDEQHVAEFKDDGWALQHPLACRPNLLDCAVHAAVLEEVEFIEGAPVEELGRYVVKLGPYGPEYQALSPTEEPR